MAHWSEDCCCARSISFIVLLPPGSPSAAPKKNQPMYAPPSPLWSLLVISLFLSEALNEHPQALLEPHRHADELPGARQAAQHPHEPREPIGHALDLVGHRADALELA